MKLSIYNFSFIALLILSVACGKPNNYSNSQAEVIRDYRINVSNTNQNFSTTSAILNHNFQMKIMTDSSLRYEVFIDSAHEAGDYITGIEIRLGNPLTEGATILNLTGKFRAGSAVGIITGLRKGLMDTLLNDNIDKYVNIKTNRYPNGLVRGQINDNIILSGVVPLSSVFINPPVTTNTTGTAIVRLTSRGVLYSRVNIMNNDPSNAVTTATIHKGSVTNLGPAVTTLVTNANQFNVPAVTPLSQAVVESLRTGSLIINVASANNPNGLLRGQLR